MLGLERIDLAAIALVALLVFFAIVMAAVLIILIKVFKDEGKPWG